MSTASPLPLASGDGDDEEDDAAIAVSSGTGVASWGAGGIAAGVVGWGSAGAMAGSCGGGGKDWDVTDVDGQIMFRTAGRRPEFPPPTRIVSAAFGAAGDGEVGAATEGGETAAGVGGGMGGWADVDPVAWTFTLAFLPLPLA